MKESEGIMRRLLIIPLLFFSGCACLTFKDGDRSANYCGVFKDVSGATFNSTINSVSLTVAKSQSDTQALSSAVSALAERVGHE